MFRWKVLIIRDGVTCEARFRWTGLFFLALLYVRVSYRKFLRKFLNLFKGDCDGSHGQG